MHKVFLFSKWVFETLRDTGWFLLFSRSVVSDSLWPLDYSLHNIDWLRKPHPKKRKREENLIKVIWPAAAAKSLQLCPTLCDPIDGSPTGSPIPEILQARTLQWVAISFSSAWKGCESEVAQSCPTLSNRMDCSPPGSSVHGIFQARVLKWGV